MGQSTTVTSKGTITIPSSIRKRLGIVQGRKVQVSISKDNKIVVDPGVTVDEFEPVREHLVASIPKGKLGLSVPALKKASEEAKIAEYERQHRK
ncbi:MAG: AbrB/MazE/SpoVT family DNA-binding domain-containing protein [Pyrinomonadaceae bacterium]